MMTNRQPRKALSSVLTALAIAPLGANASAAQESEHVSLPQAAQLAVLKNPEVQARWHAFQEAGEEVNVARGGFLPDLDVSAAVGRDRLAPRAAGADSRYTRRETLLTLRQMLFDGFATANEVRRLGKAKLVRYFEFLETSENTALEAARAYLDVLRHRRLVALAEENYVQHHAALDQLRRRAESGVGKRVDVDQAASRVALADVNLTTSLANLHDISARYLRLIGERPPQAMQPPADLAATLPANIDAALQAALQSNPALRATVENVEAAQHDLAARRAAFMPRLDLVARQEKIHNYLGLDETRDNRTVELRLNYNLFNGGSDLARQRQYRERKNIALDQREKACRDMRQTLSIAYHDTLRLSDQIGYLGQQVELVERTRNAYRDQFNIGQRTLLDLLNTQNEFFDARRAQVNAETELALAYVRSFTGIGRLLEKLGLKQIEPEAAPQAGELAPVELSELCLPARPEQIVPDRETLRRKAKELTDNSGRSSLVPQAPAGGWSAAQPSR